MATLKIEIDLNNAAFSENSGIETARILRKLSDRLEQQVVLDPIYRTGLMDINGNTVGKAYVSHPKKVDSV